VNWYATAQRDLPWRGTTDPYKVWLSEIILQQTRVVQGLPYYQRFISNYPTIIDLANAPEEEVLKTPPNILLPNWVVSSPKPIKNS